VYWRLCRNINVFFLLAEALWIWVGRKDVAFLDTFNSQLKNYSDDGINYHAPYGWRMRKYGVTTDIVAREENLHALQGMDQIAIALKMLENNPEDRRVVVQIWEAEQDLGVKSNDIPCNDLLMFKIRNGLLYTTIANRSNDLNLGLTTNVFQFSFVGEIMSKILGIGLGDQVHNSQSLHLYLNHKMTDELNKTIDGIKPLLYDNTNSIAMDFSFTDSMNALDKLKMIDFHINNIIMFLIQASNTKQNYDSRKQYEESLKNFSRYLYYVYKVLIIYTAYKKHKDYIAAIENLQSLSDELPEFANSDYQVLALNFFVQRVLNSKYMQKDLDFVRSLSYDYNNIGLF